jgi:hypothetical protein
MSFGYIIRLCLWYWQHSVNLGWRCFALAMNLFSDHPLVLQD